MSRHFYIDAASIPYIRHQDAWGLYGYNALATKYPELADEWDDELNAEFKTAPNGQPANVFNVPYTSNENYYWTRYYEIDGQVVKFTWQESVASRVEDIEKGMDELRSNFSKDIEDNFSSETLTDEFDMDAIAAMTSSEYSQPNVVRCHHSAPEIMVDKTDENHIPLVKGVNDLFSTHPLLAYEIDYEANKAAGIDVSNLHKDTTTIIWWKAPNGKSWEASPAQRLAGNASPPFYKRHTSFPEQAIYFYIQKAFKDALNDDRKTLGGKELDIYVPSEKFAIEYDGARWHTDIEKDALKNELCEEKGIRLIRIREANCPEFSESTNLEVISLENSSTKELTRAIETILDWFNIHNIKVDINADKGQIKAQYIEEVNKEYVGGHLMLRGSEIKKKIPVEEAALIKHIKFVNVDEIPPDEKVPGKAKYQLSEDDAFVKDKNGVYRDKIAGWREKDTFYITTGDNSKIYLDENCYDTLLIFPNLKSVELQNVAEKTGNDIRQLLYGVRNRPKVKILGYDVQNLDLYGKKIDFVPQEEYDIHNVFDIKDGFVSRTIETKTPLERMIARSLQYIIGGFDESEQVRIAKTRDYLKNTKKTKGPAITSARHTHSNK